MTEEKEFKDKIAEITDIEELCKLHWKQGKILHRAKVLPKANECYNFIIKEAEKDIRPVGIEKYAIKAYQQSATLHFDILAFKTAHSYLEKAEELIKSFYGDK